MTGGDPAGPPDSARAHKLPKPIGGQFAWRRALLGRRRLIIQIGSLRRAVAARSSSLLGLSHVWLDKAAGRASERASGRAQGAFLSILVPALRLRRLGPLVWRLIELGPTLTLARQKAARISWQVGRWRGRRGALQVHSAASLAERNFGQLAGGRLVDSGAESSARRRRAVAGPPNY